MFTFRVRVWVACIADATAYATPACTVASVEHACNIIFFPELSRFASEWNGICSTSFSCPATRHNEWMNDYVRDSLSLPLFSTFMCLPLRAIWQGFLKRITCKLLQQRHMQMWSTIFVVINCQSRTFPFQLNSHERSFAVARAFHSFFSQFRMHSSTD